MTESAKLPEGSWRNIVLFAICAGLGISLYSMTITLSSLIAETYSDDRWALTFPVAALVIGSFIASFPTSALIATFGRKPAFLLATLVIFGGAGVIAASMLLGAWWAILAGYFIVGMGLSASEYYVFAANDGVPQRFAGRVSGAILLGGLVAAVVGPNTGRVAQGIELMDTPLFAVPIAMGILSAIQFLILLFVRVSSASKQTKQKRMSFRKVGQLAKRPVFWSAALVTAGGYGTMTLIMNATTPWMFHHQMMLDHSTLVISLHIIGMYAPAPLSGWFADRFGTVNGAVLGFSLMVVCMLILITNQNFTGFLVALILLGMAWSLTQVSGTKRVVILSDDSNRAEFEGGNVLLMTFAKICASMSAGVLFFSGGGMAVIVTAAIFVLLGLVAVLLLPLWDTEQGSADQAAL